MDILYGRNPVLEALRSGRAARKLVVARGLRDEARLREIREQARRRGVPVEETARGRLDDIAHSEHHQGVAGYFHSRPPLGLDELLDRCRPPALVAVLDGVQDPHNLGAIARTAEAVGADGIVVARRRAAGVTPGAAKAAAGATEHIPVVPVANLAQALERMGERGLWRVGLDPEGSSRYDTFDCTLPVALVVGAEGEGLRPLTRRRCDALVAIPMLGHVASLNAAAAAAVLLYEASRQRGFAAR